MTNSFCTAINQCQTLHSITTYFYSISGRQLKLFGMPKITLGIFPGGHASHWHPQVLWRKCLRLLSNETCTTVNILGNSGNALPLMLLHSMQSWRALQCATRKVESSQVLSQKSVCFDLILMNKPSVAAFQYEKSWRTQVTNKTQSTATDVLWVFFFLFVVYGCFYIYISLLYGLYSVNDRYQFEPSDNEPLQTAVNSIVIYCKWSVTVASNILK